MSNRLTTEWTPTAEEAYGESGRQGTEGEILACEILDSLNISYTYHPENKAIQCSGIDIYVGRYGIDVKANLHSHKKQVAVDWPKIIKSKAKWWMHVSIEDPNYYIVYETKEMIKYIQDNNIRKVGDDQLCWIDQNIAVTL